MFTVSLLSLAACDSEPVSDYPALAIDVLHIEGGSALERFAGEANGKLGAMIDEGRALLAIELVELDDPTDDPALTVAYYPCVDPDGDPSDNFDPALPDRWEIDRTAPDILLPASIRGGLLSASTPVAITFPGLPLELEVSGPTITGPIVTDGGVITGFGPASLSGAVTAASLTASDLVGAIDEFQPDVDVDGDGLERFLDSCDPAVEPDGVIDCCIDGDGTEVEGAGCTDDPRFADGFALELTIHATRVLLR